MIKGFFRFLLGLFVELSVEQADRVPVSGPAIVAGNHPSLLDGVALMVAAPRPMRFLVAADLMKVPGLGFLLRACGAIPVDRRGGNGAALRGALAALERGEVIGIFPEGRTSGGAELLEFRRGVALLAHASGAPVVSCALEGTQRVSPRDSVMLRPGRVVVRFGEPFTVQRVAGKVPEGLVAATVSRCRRRVARLWAEIGPVGGGRSGWAACLVLAPLLAVGTMLHRVLAAKG